MKNKKIVDYIVVNEKVSDAFSDRAEMCHTQIRNEIHALKEELIELGVDKMRSDIEQFKIVFESRKTPNNKVIIADFSFHNKALRFSNEEIEQKISELSRKLPDLEIVEKPLLSKIKALEIKLEKQINNISNVIYEIQRDRLELTILELVNLGYVPQGGISVSSRYSYQAMVKYEED